ncbi:DNA-binding transcriptional regulator [Roseateles aquatilis]|uniref:DNA-binding transcriptional regulator n=1 Tax=Roseateles aquatilis TaxID=431061 RepID=A0A246J4P4_9BURK|nr:WYL domain-containing protein [Roseateles aquatilis]OWQ87570.1 DNA-binding transcriptional regulator [Roseateles aquatilis]
MRASRLLTLQMLLQSRGTMSATALAQALEVSVRTVHRDVEDLSAAGVPVYAERGRNGGFSLLAGWKTTLTGLTPEESQAVLLGGLSGPAEQLGLGPQVRQSQLKLLAALPADLRAQAQQVSARLHLDPVDWYRDADAVPALGTVAQGVWQGRVLVLEYESWRARSMHVVAPLGLVIKAGVWYLVGLLRGKASTLRVSKILAASLTERLVERPAGFDLATYWRESQARFERSLRVQEVVVLATPQGLAALSDLGRAVADAVAAARPARRADGRARLRIPAEATAQAARQLMPLAPEVEVLEPAALREAIIAMIEQAAARYR